ncbi:beta strand repeat-containing protein [Granulicella cerasi]|uniref:Beta strand repeat-containing protein n=1 Tax=Granulicella cerasi TaxID=741063 RepID=A0ABW1Z566_9BACT
MLVDAGGTTADVGLPGVFSQGLAAVTTAGTELGVLSEEPRPTWQTASGLPADGLRHIPDFTVSSLEALSTTLESILAEMPSGSRLGNIATTIYELAPEKGLFTQPDGSSTITPGNWEPTTGLGTLDLATLAKLYPRGTNSTYTSVTLDNSGATHGQNITFSSTVKDTSGNGGGVVPSGTVTWTMSTGVTLGPVTLSNGTASITTNQLAANYAYTVTAAYSGDSTYAGSSSNTSFSVGPEELSITATPAASSPLGGKMSVLITATSKSGVGTPTGTATLAPQGTTDTNTYSTALAGSGASTSATVTAPAVKAGNIVLLASCVSTSSDFSCYTPAQVNYTVTQATPTVSLSSTANASAGTTAFTVTVTGLGGTYPVPSGNVTIADGSSSLGAATLASGTTTLTVTTPSSSTHSYVATYQGDSNYLSASSNAQTTTGSTASTTALAINPTQPASGSTTTLTATVVSGATGTTTTPTGTVTFYQDGAALSPTGTLAGGVATFTSTTLSSTTAHTYYAVYGGDSTYATSTSPSVATAASKGTATTTTLTVSPNPPVAGSLTTLTAAIGYTGTTAPTGTVTFYLDGAALSPTATVANGVAAYTSTTLSSTTAHSFYAVYSGDSNFTTSTSAAVATAASSGTATTTKLTVSPNPPVAGSLTTLTAAIGFSGTTAPTGTVIFYQDGVALTPTATVTNGAATFTSTALSSAAAHSYTAKYSGDTTYATSTSAAVTTAATSGTATTTTLTVTPNPPVSGSLTTLTATIAYSGTTAPTGTVTFYQDGVALTPAATVTSGTATYTSTVLSGTSTHSYSAAYSGDGTYAASTSAAVSTAASGATTTTTTLAVSPNPPVSGSLTTLKATVVFSGTTTPTGTVTFYQDGVALTPAATLVVSGTTATGTFTTTTLSSTTAHTYYAVYSGDSTYSSSTSAAVATAAASGTVASTTTLTSSASSVSSGGSVTLTAKVASGATSSTTVPTGTVTFVSATQGTLGTASLASGAASLTVTLTTAGTQNITAVYSGDATYATSTSSATAVTVSSTATANFALSVSPQSVPYGSSVTLSIGLTAIPTSGTTGPAGTVTFTLTPNAGGSNIVYVATLNTTSTTTASASVTFQAPAAGNYTVTATCTGTNFSCTGLSSSAGLLVTKVVTVTNLGATPTTPTAGVQETLTAYVAFAYATTNATCTGGVTFYVNGSAVSTQLLSSNQASYSLTVPTTTSYKIYAIYLGDTNCAGSTSSVTTLAIPPATTTTAVSANYSTALQGSNEVFTALVTSVASTSNSNPGVPSGTVTFYDTASGIQTAIGSATLTAAGTQTATASIQTTGLAAGPHTITASFAGSTYFSSSDSSSVSVTIQDFTLQLSPTSASKTKGQTVTALATIAAQYGFTGSVVMGCVVPSTSYTTCTFSPTVLTGGGGITTMTITTTAAKAELRHGPYDIEFAGGAGVLAMLGWLVGRRRKQWKGTSLMFFALATVLLTGAMGCTTVNSEGTTTGSGGGTSSTSGTPSGTLQFTITGSGTDGRTTNHHTVSYSVTVQ